ncbi:hypothetical protein B0A78_08625 [Flavobacterium columnare NBRC 100251 = ATCC 23463]|uniref:hypothetical protein n=1 Tax=Flavobacterium columnare TaxID=996 RepID=UPI000BE9E687|nr:hypothetical protein [Flavobacterium columnare]PDS23671.1 hypothetical protein B0A78_08625 [Flavobacterium columnare NBRC 100251 = ATCC 23463]GEM59271.1 hypothetical protein FC1_25090 [Flavobacterium columnare NBRC 100251 = ATCC 23463]
MNTKKDSKGNIYIELENIRITYVEKQKRSNLKNWPNADVLRIQAKKDGISNSLHRGAEFPLYKKEKSIYNLIERLTKLMDDI